MNNFTIQGLSDFCYENKILIMAEARALEIELWFYHIDEEKIRDWLRENKPAEIEEKLHIIPNTIEYSMEKLKELKKFDLLYLETKR